MTIGVESPLFVAVRFTLFAAISLLIGAAVFRLVVLPRVAHSPDAGRAEAFAFVEAHLVSWVGRFLILLGFVQIARLALQHVAYFETLSLSRATLDPLLFQSPWGHAWLIGTISLALGVYAVRQLRAQRKAGWFLLSAALIVFSWTMASSGHPAAAESPGLAIAIDMAHILGAGGWVGTLFIIMAAGIPALFHEDGDTHASVAALITSFSPVALVCSSVVAISGTLAAYRNLNSLWDLIRSDYGRLLAIKLCLVAAVALLGAINMKRVLPRLGTAPATRMLRKSAWLELAVATLVLIVTAVLVATALPDS